MGRIRQVVVLALSLFLAFACTIRAKAPASQAAGTSPHWSYEGEEGPEHWADLAPSFQTCKLGRLQSPIDIPAASIQAVALDPIRFQATAEGATNFDTVALLDGPFPDGRVQALRLPLNGRLGPAGAFSVGRSCVVASWRFFQMKEIQFGPTRLPVCPVGPAIVWQSPGGDLRLGARLSRTELAGRIGSSPLRLGATGAQIVGKRFSATDLMARIGKPEAPVSCGTGGCCPTLSDATQAAAECAAGSQGIPTYVLGVGPELQNLNDIAKAGATKSAYLVGDKDVTVNVLTALNAIRGAAVIPCDLEIPPANNGGALDYGQVNVVYSTSGCNFQPAFYVASEAKCDATGGWYYDDPNAPKRVKLCPSTCDEISRPGAALRFSVGCQSLPPPVR